MSCHCTPVAVWRTHNSVFLRFFLLLLRFPLILIWRLYSTILHATCYVLRIRQNDSIYLLYVLFICAIWISSGTATASQVTGRMCFLWFYRYFVFGRWIIEQIIICHIAEHNTKICIEFCVPKRKQKSRKKHILSICLSSLSLTLCQMWWWMIFETVHNENG